MSKFPYLEQLRTENAQRAAPYEIAAEQAEEGARLAWSHYNNEKFARRHLETIIGSDIGKYAMGHMKEELSRAIRVLILKAAQKAGFKMNQYITVKIPAEIAMFTHPDSVVAIVAEQYMLEAFPRARITSESVTDIHQLRARATKITISIPSLNIARVITDDHA